MNNFVNLHVHTDSSALDGLGTKKARFKYVAEQLHQNALAITDHGTLSGIYEFVEESKKYGIKPILGIEAYFVDNIKKRYKNEKRFHLVMLAKNLKGYKNLMVMNYFANVDGFYKKPRMDRKIIKAFAKDIYLLSACPSGDILSALDKNDWEQAETRLSWWLENFGDNFFLEFEPLLTDKLSQLQLKLYKFWKRHKSEVRAVITSDAHYITPEQNQDHNKLLLINTNGKIGDKNAFKFDVQNLYLHSYDDMIREGTKIGFEEKDIKEWCHNTVEIAESIKEYSIKQERYIIPPIPEFENMDLNEILKKKCLEGLKKRHLLKQKYINRLGFELKIIYEAGFASYFLVVMDIVNWAKKNGIYVGPGRGSAAGSLISYALGITNVDPIKYDLQFERFLNPERLGGKVVKFLE